MTKPNTRLPLIGLCLLAILVIAGAAWFLRAQDGAQVQTATGASGFANEPPGPPHGPTGPADDLASEDADLMDYCKEIPRSGSPQLGQARLAQFTESLRALTAGEGLTSTLSAGATPSSAASASDNPFAVPSADGNPSATLSASDTQSAVLLTQARLVLAEELLRQNQIDAAIALLDEVAAAADPQRPPDHLSGRAAAHLRAAETANCLGSTNRFLCLLNRGGEGAYTDQNHSLAAIADLEALLNANPLDVTSQWLLNVAHMTIGTYPEGVPEAWRIPPEVFASGHEAPRFTNLAPDLGLAAVNLAGGASMDDFDGDGLLDIFTTTYHFCEHALFFHNNGDGTFADRSAAAGLSGQLGGMNVQQTDYNNDGLLDLLIMRGGWQFDFGRHRRSLLRNNGDGTFSDVTKAAGLASPAYPNHAAAWADYDLDGDLDFYSANEAGQAGPFPSQLFRSNGDGTFTDVAALAGVTNDLMAKGAAWGDTDNDGDPDLYVSNIGANRLYRNNGDGTFTDLAPELGLTEPAGRSFSTWFWDYDNDGWLDIHVAGYGAGVEQVARDYLGGPATGEHPRLYRNDGHGGFEDVTRAVGLDRILLPMGSNFGDIDNDGYEDFYLGTGSPDFSSLMPNVLFRNDAGRRFDNVTSAAGVGHLPKGHGIAFGDIDNDGDQDIYLQAGGFYPSDVSPNALFENPGGPNHWLTVKLVGTHANRAAIGARLKLVVDGADGERAIHRLIGTGSSYGANSLQAEVGLGDADRVARIEVTWPGSAEPQVVESVDADQAIEITEGESGFRTIERPAIRLYRRDAAALAPGGS